MKTYWLIAGAFVAWWLYQQQQQQPDAGGGSTAPHSSINNYTAFNPVHDTNGSGAIRAISDGDIATRSQYLRSLYNDVYSA